MTDYFYYYSTDEGDLVENDITKSEKSETILKIIHESFRNNGIAFDCKESNPQRHIYSGILSKNNTETTIHFKMKQTTPEGKGRKNPFKWRAQLDGVDRTLFAQQSYRGEPSFLIGHYSVNDKIRLQLWHITKESTAKSPPSHISINNIAESYKSGLSVYTGKDEQGSPEYSFSFKPEHLPFCMDVLIMLARKDSRNQNMNPPTKFKYNRIIFGAPGTGKSYKIQDDSIPFENRVERVTFYPSYTYGQFVGTYKPISPEPRVIEYRFTPGPFLRVYTNSLKYPDFNHLLIIEEINRANPASVFGDLFQLLDRDNGVSRYPIHASEDMKNYLSRALHPDFDSLSSDEKVTILNSDECSLIKLPPNMFIWATMNSADQGVFPIDSAFKRRWSFEYQGIDDAEGMILPKEFIIPGKDGSTCASWNQLRTQINGYLLERCKINEDKLLGPFFITITEDMTDEEFISIFKSKVLMYLFEDAAKHNRSELFPGSDVKIYSQLCSSFDEKGMDIFNQPS